MTVEIGGKERPVKFTINALIELAEAHGVDILNGFDPTKVSAKNIVAVCFIGLKHGAKSEKKDLDFSLEDVGDWLETSDDSMRPGGVMNKIFLALLKQSDSGEKSEGAGESVGAH